MGLRQTLAELRKLGTAQNVKIYRRHGAPGAVFGVSFGNLNKLARQVGTDGRLADALWQTGNFDAMNLAALIADPEALTSRDLDHWVRAADCYPVADTFVSRLVIRTPHAAAKARVWSGRRAEFTRRCGFHLARRLAEAGEQDDAFFLPLLVRIERETRGSPNRARESMNTALIAIGQRGGRLRREARRIAKALGPITIEHGETSCKTPDAVAALR